MLDTLYRSTTRVARAAMWAMAIVSMLLAAGIVVNVIARLGGQPIDVVFELTEYSMLAIPFLGLAFTAVEDSHVEVELFGTTPGTRSHRITQVVGPLVTVVVTGLLTAGSAIATLDSWQKQATFSSTLEPPRYLIYVIVPISLGLLLVQQVLLLAYRLQAKTPPGTARPDDAVRGV